MRKTYQNEEIDTSQPAVPDTVSVALDELVTDMREGLLARRGRHRPAGDGRDHGVRRDRGVRAAGPSRPERAAVRHGRERGSVILGGRRVQVERPRMRATDGSGEVAVPSYELFSDTEVLGRMAMDRMLAGLSTRRYRVGLEPVGARTEKAATSTSKVPRCHGGSWPRPRPPWPNCSPRTSLRWICSAHGRWSALR